MNIRYRIPYIVTTMLFFRERKTNNGTERKPETRKRFFREEEEKLRTNIQLRRKDLRVQSENIVLRREGYEIWVLVILLALFIHSSDTFLETLAGKDR